VTILGSLIIIAHTQHACSEHEHEKRMTSPIVRCYSPPCAMLDWARTPPHSRATRRSAFVLFSWSSEAQYFCTVWYRIVYRDFLFTRFPERPYCANTHV